MTTPITTTIIFLYFYSIYTYYKIPDKIGKNSGNRKGVINLKFSCQKSVLNETIANVGLAVSSHSTIAALEGILMECSADQVKLTGYSLDFGILKSIPVMNAQPGRIVLSAGLLSSIVGKMPDGVITLESDDKWMVTISCQDASFTVLGMDPADYPEIPTVNDQDSMELPADTLKDILEQTLFAVSKNDSYPILTGVLFEANDNQLNVVSVDNIRLALRKETIAYSGSCKFVVPGKSLSELLVLLNKNFAQEEDKTVSLRFTQRHIIFSIGGYQVISRLLEGDFLDYQRTIPTTFKTQVTVKVKDFMDSINRASIIIHNSNVISPVKCSFETDKIELTCESSLGKVKDSLPAEMEGDPLKVGFNNRYMLDALKASKCDQVLLKMGSDFNPILITPTQGDSFLFLVLPILLS